MTKTVDVVATESTIVREEKRMVATKVYADCLSKDTDADPAAEPPETGVESEVLAVAAWFDALPAELRTYFDREASSGQRAYGPA